MTREEALEWIQGSRSNQNLILAVTSVEDRATALVLVAQADAASCQQAYWVLKAHAEDLVK